MRNQLVLSDAEQGVLREVMEQCGIRTKTECIRFALGVLQWVVQQKEEGRNIVSQKDGERDREIAFPWIFVKK